MDREVWLVSGNPDGAALTHATTGVIETFADRIFPVVDGVDDDDE
jgi:hypothetical protein